MTTITLRLKADPNTVLPEAEVEREYTQAWSVRFSPAAESNTFHKNSWEPVPPPYVLPTGIGAVVSDGMFAFIRVNSNTWRTAANRADYPDKLLSSELQAGKTRLTTLSEGVEL